MIEIKNIHKSFVDNHVLKNISFKFEKGKTNLIIGESGSGKTTLLRILIGLHKIDQGEVLYDGRDFNQLNSKEKRKLRQEIGVLFQRGALYDFMNVEENIMFPLTMFTNQSYEEIQRIEPGKILSIDNNSLTVKAGDKIIELLSIDPIPGEMTLAQYIHPPSMYIMQYGIKFD